MRGFIKAICKIIQIVTLFLALIAAFFVVQKAFFNYDAYVMTSMDMEPKVPYGAMAFVNRKDSNIDIGDVVLYEPDIYEATYNIEDRSSSWLPSTNFAISRVYEVNSDDTFTLKGDAQELGNAETISRTQLRGKFKYSIPYLGKWYLKIGSKKLLYIAIGMVALTIISFFVESLYCNKKKKKKKE